MSQQSAKQYTRQPPVYHIFQMHSDKGHLIYHHTTKSSCPINCVREFIDYFEQNNSYLDYLAQIAFVKGYLKSNDINLDKNSKSVKELAPELWLGVKQLIIDYITTPEKAIEILNLIQEHDFDPYFFEQLPENSQFVEFITDYRWS